ncbi:MAG TPA: hypothetical protein VM841_01960, partial [Actinomycetota bacterium]|nr:hypothetical protein [Actinomycetota bacterium]
GVSSAYASATRDAAQAIIADLSLGVATARAVASTSSVEWKGSGLIATTSVQIDELRIASADPAVPMLTISSLRSVATASSDGRITGGSLELSGVRVALPGLPATMPCSAAKPCAATIGRDGIHVTDVAVPDQMRDVLDQALSLIAVRIPAAPAEVAGQTAAARGDAAGPGVTIASDRRRVSVSGLEIDVSADNSLEGRTVVSLRIGAASAAAIAAWVPMIDPSDDEQVDPAFVGGPRGGNPAPPPHGDDEYEPPAPRTGGPAVSRPVASSQMPESRPIPPAVALLAFAAILAGAAGLVAFGIWETAP